MNNKQKNKATDRRTFIKSAAVGSLGMASISPFNASQVFDDNEASNDLKLKVAGYDLDRIKGIINGNVQIKGCQVDFQKTAIGDANTNVFSGSQTNDITEIGLHPYMLAYANNNFRDYSLLPIFPIRVFRHKSIFIRNDRGIHKPQDLIGKRIGTPGYSSTSLTWIRGILKDEYEVNPEDIEWITSNVDSSVEASGKISKQEQVIPQGISMHKGTLGKDESDLLVSGEVDALFHAAEPKAYIQQNPVVKRLFPDTRKVERNYFTKTGIFPIMHAVAIRNSLIEENPWLPEAVFNAYSDAKKQHYSFLRKLGWAYSSLPWFAQEFEETRNLMGDNFWPYGIEPNKKALETLFRYSYEQGLSSKKLTIENLFHPSALNFTDKI